MNYFLCYIFGPFSFRWNLVKHVRKKKSAKGSFLPSLSRSQSPLSEMILWHNYSSLYSLVGSKENQSIRIKIKRKKVSSFGQEKKVFSQKILWLGVGLIKRSFECSIENFPLPFSFHIFYSLCPEINRF